MVVVTVHIFEAVKETQGHGCCEGCGVALVLFNLEIPRRRRPSSVIYGLRAKVKWLAGEDLASPRSVVHWPEGYPEPLNYAPFLEEVDRFIRLNCDWKRIGEFRGGDNRVVASHSFPLEVSED